MQTLQEAERQVVDAAMALSNALNAETIAGQWQGLMELDYACVALESARKRAEEVPPIPSYVEGWGPDDS